MPKEIVSLTRKQISEFAKDQQTVRAIESLFTVSQDMIGNKGDITVNTNSWVINNGVVNNSKLAPMPDLTVKGNVAGTLEEPSDLSFTTVTNNLDVFTATNRGVAPAAGVNPNLFLKSDGTWSAVSGTLSDGDKGDINVTGSGTVWTIEPNAVNNLKLAKMQDLTLKGNVAGTLLEPSDLSFTTVTQNLDIFTEADKGLVPAPITASGNFLQDSGIWAPVTGTISDGNKGDINVTGSTSVWTINQNAVNNLKLAQMPDLTIKGNVAGTLADPSDLSFTTVTHNLDIFTATDRGVVPASGAPTGKVLSDVGVFVDPATFPPFTNGSPGIVNPPGSATGKVLRDNNTWGLVANANMANMASQTIKGNNTGSATAPLDLTPQDVATMLPEFTATTKGVVPFPITSSNRVLLDNATWQGISTVLDTLGTSPVGSILYKGMTSWSILSPGTFGQVLKTNGPGAGPFWEGNGKFWSSVGKINTQSLASNATLQNDPELLLGISPGTYSIKGVVYFNVPTNPIGVRVSLGFAGVSPLTYSYSYANATGTSITSTFASSNNSAAPLIFVLNQAGIVRINYEAAAVALSAGTISFQWAQASASPTALQCLLGSTFECIKL